MAQRATFDVNLCRLQYAVGRVEACPKERCAFWEPGGAVLQGRCAFEQLDASDNPQLASLLLSVRHAPEPARTREATPSARRLVYRLLNEGDGP